MNRGSVRRWPLVLIAAPAAAAMWSGWVGLGSLCGFGIVHPLPGIVGGFELNTAITLPVGVEAYGALALGAWLTRAPGRPLAGSPAGLRSARPAARGVEYLAQRGHLPAGSGKRAGNSVEVLLKRYAGCLDNQEDAVNRRIENALDDDADQAPDEG
jgi:hypothetical protein